MTDITSSRISVCVSTVSQFSCFHKTRKVFLQVFFILALALFPINAFSQCNVSGNIPFVVSNFINNPYCVVCDGPWGRASPLFRVPAGTNKCVFYAAEYGVFTPLGKWNCTLYLAGEHGACDETESGLINKIFFCVQGAPPDANNSVGLGIEGGVENPELSTDEPGPPCSSSVFSFLGDNPKQEKSRPDSDVFLFDGAGGDEVTLELETNPQGGNNGGEATLGISGNSLNESTSGMPPLELDVTLPEDGKYSISVEQPRRPKDQRFRGSYILRVTPSTGSIDLIEPANNVEK
jgi:hypothetical protein